MSNECKFYKPAGTSFCFWNWRREFIENIARQAGFEFKLEDQTAARWCSI